LSRDAIQSLTELHRSRTAQAAPASHVVSPQFQN